MALRAPVNAESEPSLTGVDTGLMSGRTVDRPASNAVQKSTIALVSLTFAMLVVIVAMAAATFNKIPTSINMYVPNVTVVKPAVGLPGFTQLSWSDVLNRTSGTTVNFFTCSTCVKYNQFIDTYFIPQMLANYNIKLVRIPSQAADAVALVQQQVHILQHARLAGFGPHALAVSHRLQKSPRRGTSRWT